MQMNNRGHIKAVIDKYTCPTCKTLDGSKVLLSGRSTPPWPDCQNIHYSFVDRSRELDCSCIGCRCKVVPDKDRLKYAVGAVLCYFGLHSWGLSLNKRGRQFFERLGMTAAMNIQCERLWCSKIKTYEEETKAM